ncbi:MAG: polysaccharide biosynthesis tyrosine autokinase [Anaerolinea sp.]
MELTHYIRLVRKWAWLLILAGFVAAGITFVVNVRRPPVFQASTTLSIGRFIEAPNPNSGDIRTGIDLAQTYAQLVTTFNVLQATVEALGLPISPDSLRSSITTRILPGTSLLVVTVSSDNPVVAADLANTLAEQLIAQSPTNLTPEQQQQVAFLNAQIQDLTVQVQQSRQQLDQVNAQLSSTTTPQQLEALTIQRNAIIDQINSAQANIARFTETIASLQQRTNALDIVERARIPTQQSSSRIETTVLLGAIVGVALAFGVVLLIEYLDDTIRTTEDATQTLAVPVLGAIVRFGKRPDRYDEMLLTNYPSMSPIAEGYRTARTNMLFSESKDHKRVFVVTSANPQEGKTVTTVNLAIAMAQAGLQVLLIDADLRRPRVHEAFKLENTVGLTTLLFSTPDLTNNDPTASEQARFPALAKCVQYTGVPKLRVLTSGFVPSNPTEILGSAIMTQWIAALRSSPTIDVIIIDTPPSLAAADSAVLAATIGADVLLVIDCGKTRRGAALRAKEQFTKLNIPIAGVIVNRINPRDEEYGYYYGYYYTPQNVGAPAQSRGKV